MSIAIIDYGSGNLRSVAKAFERVAGKRRPIAVTSASKDVAAANHIVLPGVGAFADCMNGLKALPGMMEVMAYEVQHQKKPFLGICVGMQMLFERGHEHGVHAGLGWLEGEVVKFNLANASYKVPHMGWNNLSMRGRHPLMKGIPDGSHAYFVHSYHALCGSDSDVIATVDYGQSVTAVVGRDNIMGTQFHPEKSQETGLKLLSNFLEL